MKDGRQGDRLISRLEPVMIGSDNNGKPLTSLVVVEELEAKPAAAAAKAKTLPDGARIALEALKDAIEKDGLTPPVSDQVPVGVRGVSVATWRQYAYAHGIAKSSEMRARQTAFKRARNRLVADGVVDERSAFLKGATGEAADFVYIVRENE
jgi:hypothetical protein